MPTMTDAVKTAVSKASAKCVIPEQGDYYGDDGLLRCGTCGGKRETIINLKIGGTELRKKVGCVCKCEDERREKEKAEMLRRETVERLKNLKRASLMDERFFSARFSNAEETVHNKKNLAVCRNYAKNFNEMVRKHQGLLFWGDVGTGKSYAAACIANELMDRGVPVIMTSFVKAVDMFRSHGQEGIMDALSTSRLVIFDDLGAERSTEYAIEKVYDIIDSRYRSGLPMIVTTNLSMKEMLEEKDMRYSRIFDRIFEMCYPMQWTGPSWRKVKAKGRFNEMGGLLGG